MLASDGNIVGTSSSLLLLPLPAAMEEKIPGDRFVIASNKVGTGLE